MYTLALDTSHKFLLVVLMDDEKTIDYIQMECLKQQSEFILIKIEELLNRNNVQIEEVGNVVVTVGPGSYTGVRIAMTVAKILGSIAQKTVYSLSTLQLYAGKKDCYVVMDARAKRVYAGRYNNGEALQPDSVIFNEEMEKILSESTCQLVGDVHLFKDEEDEYTDIAENFMILKDKWVKVDNIDTLTPVYLKSKEDYFR